MPSTRGIVISHENFGEADRYVRFLTLDWGVITLLARSARKSQRRYVGGLDLFCHDEIFIRGEPREKGYLNELTVLNSFPAIRESLDRVLLAGKITQWVRKLADTATPMPSVYRLLGQTLSLIAQESDPEKLELLDLIFRLKLLSSLGLQPKVDACVKCGDTEAVEVVFDLEAGGVVCGRCLPEAIPTLGLLSEEDRGLVAGAERFRFAAWNQIRFPSESTRRLLQLVTRFAEFHAHLRLPA